MNTANTVPFPSGLKFRRERERENFPKEFCLAYGNCFWLPSKFLSSCLRKNLQIHFDFCCRPKVTMVVLCWGCWLIFLKIFPLSLLWALSGEMPSLPSIHTHLVWHLPLDEIFDSRRGCCDNLSDLLTYSLSLGFCFRTIGWCLCKYNWFIKPWSNKNLYD